MGDGNTSTRDRPMRVGIVGLGTASTDIVPEILRHPQLDLAVGCDIRAEARTQFTHRYGVPAFETVEELVSGKSVDAVYVASPNRFHCEHAVIAASYGKELIVEKPLALTLAECDEMVAAAAANGVRLLAGHTHSFDAPIQAMEDLIADGVIGEVYMVNNWYYTDWLFRGRLADELDVGLGGGVVFRQAPHSVDIVRVLAAARPVSVRAVTSSVDTAHPTHGGFVALLTFDSGAVGNIVFSGYAHFDSSELTFGIGENGYPRSPDTHLAARRRISALGSADAEAQYKNSMRFGGDQAGQWLKSGDRDPSSQKHPCYGLTVVSGTRGDLRQTPDGIFRYGSGEWLEVPVARAPLERAAELDCLYNAWKDDTDLPSHDGRWAKGTLEVCLAIIESGRTGREVSLHHQLLPRTAAAAGAGQRR
ncbi:MAG: gfo/Idh/MocA family oxidoreductase [Streptosporangiales bacterium]|nr:gfo/Idh/MocA family oxidoreductase [Streptosporangiales bacterium]